MDDSEHTCDLGMSSAEEVQPIIFAKQLLISQADEVFERDREVNSGGTCEGVPVESFRTVDAAIVQPLQGFTPGVRLMFVAALKDVKVVPVVRASIPDRVLAASECEAEGTLQNCRTSTAGS